MFTLFTQRRSFIKAAKVRFYANTLTGNDGESLIPDHLRQLKREIKTKHKNLVKELKKLNPKI